MTDTRSRVRYMNRYTEQTTCQLVRPIRGSRRAWVCSRCGGTIRQGGLHWQTLNQDGRICATCFILTLEVDDA